MPEQHRKYVVGGASRQPAEAEEGDTCCGPGDGGPASFGTPSLPVVPEAEACPPRRSGAANKGE